MTYVFRTKDLGARREDVGVIEKDVGARERILHESEGLGVRIGSVGTDLFKEKRWWRNDATELRKKGVVVIAQNHEQSTGGTNLQGTGALRRWR